MKLEALADGENKCISNAGCLALFVPNPFSLRTQLRERFQIKAEGSRAQDFLSVLFCPILSQVQHIKQLEYEQQRTVRFCGEFERDI